MLIRPRLTSGAPIVRGSQYRIDTAVESTVPPKLSSRLVLVDPTVFAASSVTRGRYPSGRIRLDSYSMYGGIDVPIVDSPSTALSLYVDASADRHVAQSAVFSIPIVTAPTVVQVANQAAFDTAIANLAANVHTELQLATGTYAFPTPGSPPAAPSYLTIGPSPGSSVTISGVVFPTTVTKVTLRNLSLRPTSKVAVRTSNVRLYMLGCSVIGTPTAPLVGTTGIMCQGSSEVYVDDCQVEGFAVGIDGATVVRNSFIGSCTTALLNPRSIVEGTTVVSDLLTSFTAIAIDSRRTDLLVRDSILNGSITTTTTSFDATLSLVSTVVRGNVTLGAPTLAYFLWSTIDGTLTVPRVQPTSEIVNTYASTVVAEGVDSMSTLLTAAKVGDPLFDSLYFLRDGSPLLVGTTVTQSRAGFGMLRQQEHVGALPRYVGPAQRSLMSRMLTRPSVELQSGYVAAVETLDATIYDVLP